MGQKLETNLTDNFQFLLVGAGTKYPFRSYISSIDPTAAEAGILIAGSQNVYKTLKGTISVRQGMLRRGVADATIAGVKSSYEWETSLGYTRPLRVVNGNLQVEFDPGTGIQEYTLLSGLTLSRFVFAPWWNNSLKKDDLIFVKGDNAMYYWSGGMGVVAAVSNATGIIAQIEQPNYYQESSGGIGYKIGDVLTVGGTGTGATLIVDSVQDPASGSPVGGVSSVTIYTGGTGFAVNDIIALATPAGGATCYLQVTGVSGGVVTSVSIKVVGNGYSGGGVKLGTHVSGSGVDFSCFVTIGSTITKWHLVQNGSGYAAASNVVLNGGTGIGATLQIDSVANYSITLKGGNGINNVSQLGFENSGGQVVINGNTYSYLLSNANGGLALVGISTDPTSEAIGSVAIQPVSNATQLPDSNNPTFTNDFIEVINNQLHVGSYISRLIYVSSNNNWANFTVPNTRVAGDPDLLTLDSSARAITVQKGTSGQAGNAVISGSKGDWYTIVRSNVTVNNILAEQVDVSKSQSADLATALAHEFITNVGDTIIFLDQNNQLREFGTVRNITNPVYPLLSLDVFTELQNLDFTGGHLRAVADEGGETVYITCPKSGIDYMYQIRQQINTLGNLTAERLWQPPQVRGLSRIAVINGVTYGYSNTNPQLYQLWNTGQWHDDSPGNEPVPYTPHLFLAYINNGRDKFLFFDKFFAEGYMTQATNLNCNIFEEYQGSGALPTIVLNSTAKSGKTAKLYTSQQDASLGEASLGDNPLGDGIIFSDPSLAVPKFRCIRTTTPKDIFEYALDVYSDSLDAQWEILCLGVNQLSTGREPIGIRN